MIKKQLIFIFFLSLVIFPNLAQTQSSQGASISPLTTKVELEPEDTHEAVLKVKNKGSKQTTFYIKINNFLPANESGQLSFFPADKGNERYAMANWIEMEKTEFTLKPDETIKIPFTVTVPKDAGPGDHYAAIFTSTMPPESAATESSDIVVGSQVGSLVFVTVPGDIIEEGQITKFNTSQKIYQKLPVTFLVGFENAGNVLIKPTGKINIVNWKGNGIKEINFGEDENSVLPQSTIEHELLWESTDKLLIGRYQADLEISFGDPQKQETASVVFWILPLKLILIILTALIIFIVLLRKAIKRYNQWIINKSKPTSQPRKPAAKKVKNKPKTRKPRKKTTTKKRSVAKKKATTKKKPIKKTTKKSVKKTTKKTTKKKPSKKTLVKKKKRQVKKTTTARKTVKKRATKKTKTKKITKKTASGRNKL